MVKSQNELIYTIRQVIGEEESDGFFTYIDYNNEIIKVPNYLFKDAPSEYPEIRISPFLRDEQTSHPIRIKGYNNHIKRKVFNAKFQIDIYATNIAQANQIYDAISRRIDLFYDIDIVHYGYDKNFIEIGPNLYFNKEITSKDFKFSGIRMGSYILDIAQNEEELKQNNTYLLNEKGLFVHTPFNIKWIRMGSIINGLLLPDGHTTYSKGIIKMNKSNKIMLSDLQNNDVERISFELDIFYSQDSERNSGPIATHTVISDYYGR